MKVASCVHMLCILVMSTPVMAWVPMTMQRQAARSSSLILQVSQSSVDTATASNAESTSATATFTTALASTIPHDVATMDVHNMTDYYHHQGVQVHGELQIQGEEGGGGFSSWANNMLDTYWGPRVLLLVLAAVYATNFPLGALMNDHLPASAATASRMFVAGLALAPFIPQLKPELRVPAVLCGCFTALGYVTQSLALADVDPARVSFLGSATVLWCPMLEGLIEKKPMGLREAPQTWMAALLCMAGIGILELSDSSLSLSMSWGDALALLQAVGFGTGVFWTSRMLRDDDSSQALPVTATLIATTAALSLVWCVADGWMDFATNPDWFQLTLPGMAMEESMRPVLSAVLWTGLISTSLNFFVELTALSKVKPSEASVLLASEPLWAALFAAAFYGSHLNLSDGVGGILIVAACLVNALVSPDLFQTENINPTTKEDEKVEQQQLY